MCGAQRRRGAQRAQRAQRGAHAAAARVARPQEPQIAHDPWRRAQQGRRGRPRQPSPGPWLATARRGSERGGRVQRRCHCSRRWLACRQVGTQGFRLTLCRTWAYALQCARAFAAKLLTGGLIGRASLVESLT